MLESLKSKLGLFKSKMDAKTVNCLVIIGTIVFAIAAFFCGIKYFHVQRQYSESIETYAEIASEYVSHKETRVIATEAGAETDKEQYEELNVSPIEVDFDELSAQACRGTVAAWIYCEDTVINYPVAHCDDNEFYLERQLNGNYNACGTLFIDCRCKGDFSDGNTIIYGHHMADGQMFNTLKFYRQKDGYYAKHPVMYINTPNGNYEMQIYSTFVSDTQSMAFTTAFANDEAFQEFIDFTLINSLLDTDIEVTAEDHIITLVTCSYEFNNARTIVCGKLIPIG